MKRDQTVTDLYRANLHLCVCIVVMYAVDCFKGGHKWSQAEICLSYDIAAVSTAVLCRPLQCCAGQSFSYLLSMFMFLL